VGNPLPVPPLTVTASADTIAIRRGTTPVGWTLTGATFAADCGITLQHKASGDWVDGDLILDATPTQGILEIDDLLFQPGIHEVIAECSGNGRAIDEVVAKLAVRSSLKSAQRSTKKVPSRASSRSGS
jgi:hypothetical protein